MKKIIYKLKYIALLLLIMAVFSGCTDIKVIGKITSQKLVSYTFDVSINTNWLNESQETYMIETLQNLNNHWIEEGYNCTLDKEKNTYHLVCTTEKQCSSYEEAFTELFAYMTSDTSLLSTYSYTYTEHFNYNEYHIFGSLDASNIINEDIYNTVPESIQATLNKEIHKANISLVFDLPNQDDYSFSEDTQKQFISSISMDTVTQFDIIGKINNTQNLNENQSIIDMIIHYKNLVYVLIGIFFVIVILLILLIKKLR